MTLRVRRFFCDEGSCERRIFYERLPESRSKTYNLNGKGGKEDAAMTIGYYTRAYRLLEAIHDLAGGDPQTAVLSARVSARNRYSQHLLGFHHAVQVP